MFENDGSRVTVAAFIVELARLPYDVQKSYIIIRNVVFTQYLEIRGNFLVLIFLLFCFYDRQFIIRQQRNS